MFQIEPVQQALREFGLDGWLMYDFRGSNVLVQRILKLDPTATRSRRWYYFVPAKGEPVQIVHRIEQEALAHLPGQRRIYLLWQELQSAVRQTVAGSGTIAMEYSPNCANPYVSRVDAGTVELVRNSGPKIVSSGDLVQLFEATWDDEQWNMHREAAVHTVSAFEAAWKHIAQGIRQKVSVTECSVLQVIAEHFRRHGLITDHAPIVAVGPHSGNPHFETSAATDTPIREGDLVLVDLWGKLDRLRSVYSDLTRMGYVGRDVAEPYARTFEIVAQARDAAIRRIQEAFASGKKLSGWEVDRAARDVIEAAGHGQDFIHRTGHSIGQETHGNGANMDDLETHEERLVLPRTCFSIEPGIYLAEYGIRSEVNVFIDAAGGVHVTGGPPQERIVPILAAY